MLRYLARLALYLVSELNYLLLQGTISLFDHFAKQLLDAVHCHFFIDGFGKNIKLLLEVSLAKAILLLDVFLHRIYIRDQTLSLLDDGRLRRLDQLSKLAFFLVQACVQLILDLDQHAFIFAVLVL